MFPNKYQRIIIGCSLIVVLLMRLFPPFIFSAQKPVCAGYRFIFSVYPIAHDPTFQNDLFYPIFYKTDYSLLAFQYILVILISFALLAITHKKFQS